MSIECVCGTPVPLWDLRRHASISHSIYNCDLTGRHRPLIDFMIANRIRFNPTFKNPNDARLWMELLPDLDFQDEFEYIQERRQNKKDLGKQNVHDSGITKSVVDVVRKLKDKTKIELSNEAVIKEIHKYDKTLNIAPYIDDEGLYSALGMTMMGVLSLVWHNIRTDLENRFPPFRSNVIDGSKVCTTGRITRLIDSLSGIDDSVKLLSSVDYTEEMLSKGAAIRNKFEPNPNLTEAENNDILVKVIRDTLHRDYDGILGTKVTDRFINDWINDIT